MTRATGEGFYVIDSGSRQIVDFVAPTIVSGPFYSVPTSLAVMRNGKAFYWATEPLSFGLYSYDPLTRLSTHITLPGLNDLIVGLAKSADGTRLVFFSSSHLWLYDGDSDSYVSDRQITPDIVSIRDVKLNSDGSRILVDGHRLFDKNLTQIADLTPGKTAGYSTAYFYRGATFSPDGSKIYSGSNYLMVGSAVGDQGTPAIAVYDANTAAIVGYVPDSNYLFGGGGLAVSDSTAVLLSDQGFTVFSVRGTLPNLARPLTSNGSTLGVSPSVGTLSNPDNVTVFYGGGTGDPSSVYFGGQSGSGLSVNAPQPFNSNASVRPPAATQSGPVDVVAVRADGWAAFAPHGYSYGPSIQHQDISVGGTDGGTSIRLYGYGFGAVSAQPQVTIGGKLSKSALSACPSVWAPPCLTVLAPSGNVGPADIVVTNPFGMTTEPGGFRYVAHRLIPGLFPYQMILDETRGFLYAADAITGNVQAVDARTLSVSTLLSYPATPITAIAMTPDKTRLLAVSPTAGTVTVLDLTSGSVRHTFFPVPEDERSRLVPTAAVATARGTALVSCVDLDLFDGGQLFEIDLETGSAITVVLPPTVHARTLFASAEDGQEIVLAGDGNAGYLSHWDASISAVTHERFSENEILQLAASASGDRFVQDFASLTSELAVDGGLYLNNLMTLERSQVRGEKLHSSGDLRYIVTTKGIEIYDVQQGALVLSIGVPSGTLSTDDGLVIDRAGGTLFVAQQDGVGVINLGKAPLSIGQVVPMQGNARGGDLVTLRGSGFLDGATVTVAGKVVPATVVDSTKLTFIAPPSMPQKLAVTVTNPGAETYTIYSSYDTSNPLSRPALLLNSAAASSDRTRLTVTGSGFTADTRVALNGVRLQTTFVSAEMLYGFVISSRDLASAVVTAIDTKYGVSSNRIALPAGSIVQLSISLSRTQLNFLYTTGGAVPPPQAISVSNSGGGGLTWTANSSSAWLLASPPNSSLSTLAVSIDPSGLSPGFYDSFITVGALGANPHQLHVTLTVATVTTPVISQVANAFGEAPLIAANTWVELKGLNLAPTGRNRIWSAADFVNNRMPTQLDGVSVTVNGRSAFLYYISANQVNILTPPDTILGLVQVQLNNNGVASNVITVHAQPLSPSFFAFVSNGAQYVYGRHLDASLIGPPNMLPGIASTPVKPGETISIAANGFGPTPTPVVPGSIAQSEALPALPSITIDGVSATVLSAGLVSPGNYLLNLVVPASLADGDKLIIATYNGVMTQPGALLTIQH